MLIADGDLADKHNYICAWCKAAAWMHGSWRTHLWITIRVLLRFQTARFFPAALRTQSAPTSLCVV